MKNLLFIYFALLFFGCENKSFHMIEKWNIKKTMQLKAYEKNNYIYIDIYRLNSKKRFTINSKVSSLHKWDIKWSNNNRIIINSSDVGILMWIYNSKNKKWVKKYAIDSFSPQCKFVIRPSLLKNETVSLEIGIPLQSAYGYDVIQTINSNLKVKNLIECISWQSDESFILHGINKHQQWKMKNGIFRKEMGTRVQTLRLNR